MRLIRALMVGERCTACNRVHGYRKARPEETLSGRFRHLFEVKDCPSCFAVAVSANRLPEPTATQTWAVWWEMPVA